MTAFLPADPAKIDAGVEPALFTYLDFATVQGYDLAGAWDPVTGHQSNLYTTASSPFSVDLAIDTYLSLGAPAGKLVVGIPFYGRGWAGVGGDQQRSVPARERAGPGHVRGRGRRLREGPFQAGHGLL